MDSVDIDVRLLAFAVVNVPIASANILMNVFFAYCVFFTEGGSEDAFKQPLKLLLGSFISCNVLVNLCIYLFLICFSDYGDYWLFRTSSALILYGVRTGFSSSLGINVFYFFQIVPVHHPLLTWLKKHLNGFVISALVFDRTFLLFRFSLYFISWGGSNSTLVSNSTSDAVDNTGFYVIVTDFILRCAYFVLCLGIMVATCSATVVYLRNHMKSLKKSSSSFSVVRTRKQMKVTVMGIIQTSIFFFASGWIVVEEITTVYFGTDYDPDGYLLFSITAIYSLGSTVILAVGQLKFRVRLVSIARKLLPFLKS